MESDGVEAVVATDQVVPRETQDAEVVARAVVVAEVAKIEVVFVEGHLLEVVDADAEVDGRVDGAIEGIESIEDEGVVVVAGPEAAVEAEERGGAGDLGSQLAYLPGHGCYRERLLRPCMTVLRQ